MNCRVPEWNNQVEEEALERTNIFLPTTSGILLPSKNCARTMPAGHSLPPHSVSLVWRTRGGLRIWSNARVTCCDGIGMGEGTRSSDMVRRERESAGLDVMSYRKMSGREGLRVRGGRCSGNPPRSKYNNKSRIELPTLPTHLTYNLILTLNLVQHSFILQPR